MANELIIKNGLIVDLGGVQVTGSTTSTQGFIKPGASNQYLLADGTTTTGPASPFPYTGSALITGSLIITGSLDVTQGITGSLFGTSSNALTASYVNPLNQFVIITGSLSQGAAGNKALGQFSHAEGSGSFAPGTGSHAEGLQTSASGQYSHAEGDGAKATGYGSHAEGQATQATGQYSHAEGGATVASNAYTHAEGQATQATGQYSHAEGSYTRATGQSSHAEGSGSFATATGSHSEGLLTSASGIGSHAEGFTTRASGQYSHAEGIASRASGYGSHAEGDTTQATATGSHAEGYNTLASGQYSHAEGYSTQASGQFSHAEGSGTVAKGDYQHVQGQYNISSSVAGAFIHGNGTSDATRSNLIYAYSSVVEITGSLNVSGSIIGFLLGTASYANTASFVLFDGLENYVAMFTSNNDLTSSNIYVTESGMSVNTTSSNAALTVNSTNISRDALQIQITGSTYFAVNNEGVMVLSPFYNTPTAISGGFIYSASGEYFIGIP